MTGFPKETHAGQNTEGNLVAGQSSSPSLPSAGERAGERRHVQSSPRIDDSGHSQSTSPTDLSAFAEIQNPRSNISLAAILLAAGQSSRMGRPKMLLPWGKTTILGHLIALWNGLPASQIVVVCAAHDTAIHAELDRLKFPRENRIMNPDTSRGMFSSLQCAARWPGWHPALTHWAIALGDQPHLQLKTLETLVNFAAQNPGKICQPARHDHARHPVVLPKSAFRKLAISKSETLKEFLQPLAAGLSLVEVNDPGLELDIDLPADYEKALQLLHQERE